MSKATTPKPRFQSHYNATDFPDGRKEPKQTNPSLTIPNQSLTIQEIYKRYATGRPLGGSRELIYDDDGTGKMVVNFDDYMPDLGTLDLADRQEVLTRAKIELDRIKKELDGIAKARKSASEKENEELKKRLAKLEAERNPPKTDDPV